MPLLGWLSGQPAGEDLAVTESGFVLAATIPGPAGPAPDSLRTLSAPVSRRRPRPAGPGTQFITPGGRQAIHDSLVFASTSTWPQYLICTPMAASLRDRVARRDGQSARWMMWMAVSVLPLLRALITTSVSFPSDLVGSRPPSMTV